MAPRWPGPKPGIGSDKLELLFDGLINNLIKSIVKAVLGIFIPGGGNGIPGMPAGANPLSWLSDLVGMRWAQVDAVADGQLALNDRVDLISPLEDFGATYAPGQGEIMNTGKVPFNRPIGPLKGCHLASNGIVLDDRGVWKINARLAFGFTVAPGGGGATWEVRVVKDSTGEIFMNRIDKFNTISDETRQLSFPVVIPEGGYRVEAHITSLVIGRGMKGGPAWNGLSCHHLSHSTANIVGN